MLAKTLVLLGVLALTYAYDQSYDDEPVVVVRSPLTRKMCPDGTYMNRETNECENCRECGEYMYIRRECSRFSNTECGWCGSTQIVKSEDFIRKCQFTFYKEIRQKLRKEFGIDEAEDDEGELVEERKIEDSEGKIHVVHLQRRTDLDEEDSKDLRLADEEDFMKRPVVYMNNQDEDEEEESEEDLTSSEIDEEVHAEMIDEHDIGESPDSEDADDLVEEVRPNEMKENEEESLEDLPVLVRADEIQEIPMKIIVSGNIQKFEDSEEENSASDSDEDEEKDIEAEEADMTMSNDKLLSSNSRTLLRICLMSLIVVIIYMWVSKFMSRRRRHHILVLPDMNTFTDEQKKMMDRCACQLKNKEEGHCYENKLAYI